MPALPTLHTVVSLPSMPCLSLPAVPDLPDVHYVPTLSVCLPNLPNLLACLQYLPAHFFALFDCSPALVLPYLSLPAHTGFPFLAAFRTLPAFLPWLAHQPCVSSHLLSLLLCLTACLAPSLCSLPACLTSFSVCVAFHKLRACLVCQLPSCLVHSHALTAHLLAFATLPSCPTSVSLPAHLPGCFACLPYLPAVPCLAHPPAFR